jgi:PAS domain S-box-containing protein
MAYTIETSLGKSDTSLALLKVLAENSFDSILVTEATAKGEIIYANKAFKKLTGYEPSDVIGKTPRILQGVGTDKEVIDRLADALKSGKKFEGKAINYKKDGQKYRSLDCYSEGRFVHLIAGTKLNASFALSFPLLYSHR